MPFLYVDTLSAYYRRIVDDPDASALDAADVALHLEQGEAEYRNIVASVAPSTFRARQAIAVNGNSYDLVTGAVKLAGAGALIPAAAQRISRIHQLSVGTGTTTYRINPVRDWEDFQVQAETGSTSGQTGWFLDGTTLRFTTAISTTVQIDYLPVSNVNWSNVAPAPNQEWIDDLVEWHDIIALLAAAQYFIEISRDDPRLAQQLAARMRDFKRYLTDGRISGRRDRVTPVP